MMQEYQTLGTDTSSATASTNIQPSEHVLHNILSFARSTQNITAEGLQIKIYLN